MAYNKKNGKKTDNLENKVDKIIEVETEVVTEKAEESKVETSQTDKELINKLLAQNELLMKMLIEKGVSAPVVMSEISNSLNEEITLVHLKENAPGLTTHIELSNLTIDLNAFGEERTLDRRQAEELAGKYRKFFDRGVIAFGAGSEHLAGKFGLKSVSDYSYINKDFLKKLGTLSLIELENLYNKLSEGHKTFVIEYFKRKILEKDANFNNIHKIELLNRISDGAMSGTTLDMKREAEEAAAAKN